MRESIIPLLEDSACRRILLRAPVKVGKREMVEYIAKRDDVLNPQRIHAFLSAWHRTADEEQRLELREHNMTVFSIINKSKADEFLRWMNAQIALGKQIVIHLDECDHGTGARQTLSRIWPTIRDNENINAILYSATPEEVLFSGEVEDEPEHQEVVDDFVTEGYRVRYPPPIGYCGAARFLDEGLVFEAMPFFEQHGTQLSLSQQGKEIIRDFRQTIQENPSRNLLILRLSYSMGSGKRSEVKANKAFHKFLKNIRSFPELHGISIKVDKGEGVIRYPDVQSRKIDWSSRPFWDDLAIGRPMIFVVDQTCSRSTELKCHDRLFALHDFRNQIQFSTISQAQERVNHYEQRYGGFQPIRVYGSRRAFQLSAGRIDYETFLNYEWEKRKIDARTSGPTPMYRILSAQGRQRHERCPEEGMAEAAADRLLQELGCYADISVSARVAGGVKQVRNYIGSWYRCSKDTWDQVLERYINDNSNSATPSEGTREAMRNPFIAAESHRLPDGTWQGQHRGWKVLDYDGIDLWQRATPTSGLTAAKKIDLGSTGGDRRTVCYKDGILGVFFAKCTGTRTVNTLETFKSMYKE